MTAVGGRCDSRVASTAGTPWAVRPVNRGLVSDEDRPRMIRLKKMPIDSTMDKIGNVDAMPPPPPRGLAGSEFMMQARFGEANRPMPAPLRNRIAANSG